MALTSRGGGPAAGGVPRVGGAPGAGYAPATDHGGDVWAYARAYGRAPLDLSVNVNPLGMPASARAAAAAALADAAAYPDLACRDLRRAIARRLGWGSRGDAWVGCGTGAADVLYRLALALRPRVVLTCAPTFSEYGRAAALAGARVRTHRLPADGGGGRPYSLDEGLLDEIVPGVDLVVLCEPNNPTGLAAPRALLMAVLARCEEAGATLVVDECFNGLLDDPAAHSLRRLVPAHPRLVVVDAFTKTYGMAGLRLGYALCADAALLVRMARCGQPWPASNVALAAAQAALDDDGYLARTHALLGAQRPRVAAALRAAGCELVSGEANFLLFRHALPDLHERLARRGVLVRDCGSFAGLPAGCLRVAVGAPQANDRFLEALRASLREGEGDANVSA